MDNNVAQIKNRAMEFLAQSEIDLPHAESCVRFYHIRAAVVRACIEVGPPNASRRAALRKPEFSRVERELRQSILGQRK